MAKRSKVVANDRRRATVARYAVRRRELQAVIRSPRTDSAERRAAEAELRAQPRDASPTRVRSRDVVDGRPRGVLTRFGLSRIRFREMAHAGGLPGIRKASW